MLLPMRRKLFSAWTAWCGIAALVAPASVGPEAVAQVVQLPATQTFGYSGAVTVPDFGQAHLGGVARHRAAAAGVGSGPIAGRPASSASGGTSVTASVSIIDLQAMDAAILNLPADAAARRPVNYQGRNAGTPIINTLAPRLYARRMGTEELPPPNDPNAWEIALGGGPVSKVGPANTIVRDNSDVRYFMQRAKQASDVGRTAAALVYYRLAYERLTPEQRERLHEFQAQANAAAQGGKVTATEAAAVASASQAAAAQDATAGAATADTDVPGNAALGSDAAATPAAVDGNANPFDSPF